ncbi:MAG: hypothetical protein WBO97_13115 [Tepidiformaceae bacterium]
MVTVTISVSEGVYQWLSEKAATSNRSVQALIEDQVQRLSQEDPDDPEFVAALEATIRENKNLLRRLAQ